MLDFVWGEDPLLLCGFAAGMLSLFAYLPYLRDTISGSTQPLRASWMIWSVLGSISLAGQFAEDAGSSIWFATAQVGGTITVFFLSIWYGAGGYLNQRDGTALGIATFGLALWAATDTPGYALGIAIAISLIGGAVTVLKSYQTPNSETLITWSMSFVASALAIVAVGKLDPILLAYPAYLFALNGAIITAIFAGRWRDRLPRSIATTQMTVAKTL